MAKVILKSYLKSIHGRVGNLIYYNVHGNQYIRSYSVPYNPRTFKQQKNRRAFRDAVMEWQSLAPHTKDTYRTMARGKPISGYNLFISLYMKGLNPDVNTGQRAAGIEPVTGRDQFSFSAIPFKNRHNAEAVVMELYYAYNDPVKPPGRMSRAA
ncbi:MAG: hypothetical protein GXY14_01175 [Spirochaetes bacterium]|nr:hypothetical protein [Spirochaetota bacterium]